MYSKRKDEIHGSIILSTECGQFADYSQGVTHRANMMAVKLGGCLEDLLQL